MMDDADGYFGESVAATYDDSSDVFGPGPGPWSRPGCPTCAGFRPGQTVLPWQVSGDRWVSYSFDLATRQMQGHYIELAEGQGEYRSIPFRYVWSAELDLMARLAGLRLRDRWAGWAREPFTGESRQHVSVWQKDLVSRSRFHGEFLFVSDG